MEKSKKKEGLSRLFEIAGQRKGLLILAGLLSAGSAVCMLVPYWAVYEILKELLSNGSNLSALDGTDMMRARVAESDRPCRACQYDQKWLQRTVVKRKQLLII